MLKPLTKEIIDRLTGREWLIDSVVQIAITGTQLPFIIVPTGWRLQVTASALNPARLQIAHSLAECRNINQSYLLQPNEAIIYSLENANKLWIAAGTIGCFAHLSLLKT